MNSAWSVSISSLFSFVFWAILSRVGSSSVRYNAATLFLLPILDRVMFADVFALLCRCVDVYVDDSFLLSYAWFLGESKNENEKTN